MRKVILTAFVAVVAIGGAFASKGKTVKPVLDTYYEKTNCNLIQCDTPETGLACSELTLYLNCTDLFPVTNTPGYVIPN